MKTVYSEKHRLHAPKEELHNGLVGPPFEKPERAEMILKALKEKGCHEILAPEEFSFRHIEALHDPGYLKLLQSAAREWRDLGRDGDALPANWAAGTMRTAVPPVNLDGRLGYYSFSGDSRIGEGTWTAALSSAHCALTGMKLLLSGESGVFSLCRPPGHHAARDLFGGYCFLNNAALAAQYALDAGAAKTAILDLDFHHGNGTQDLFYHRKDVYFFSLHGDPLYTFPYFTGFADQRGSGEGEGFTMNYPLLPGSDAETWFAALDDACRRLREFRPEVLVVSLGVDTYEGDPLSSFKIRAEDFIEAGRRLGALKLPTLIVMEGGYAVDDIGVNVCNVLHGYAEENPA
ncbi:MAG: histone deacetylase family protein [Spirochaetales bacterium]|nr:histone deacetylase family protein [Spirochaetales bacterium]